MLEALRAEPSEVARIFDHPLEALLDPELVRGEEGLVPIGSEDWPYEEELHVRLCDLSRLVPRPSSSSRFSRPFRLLVVMIDFWFFRLWPPRLESCLG